MLIEDYNKLWPLQYKAIKKVLNQTLHGVETGIEHVGSTAVPELAAKAIIDIDIIFFHDEGFEQIRTALEKIDYYHNGDQGLPGREVFKRKKLRTKHLVLDEIKHHLYVCPIKSDQLEKHLLFRDFLRTSDEARKKYTSLKRKIAENANQDRKIYATLKENEATDFIGNIVKRAKKLI